MLRNYGADEERHKGHLSGIHYHNGIILRFNKSPIAIQPMNVMRRNEDATGHYGRLSENMYIVSLKIGVSFFIPRK
ncbi:MAG: hypothetical protein JST63_01420 [Bacteroidetes bacterium]|nr:hypothetical protein [Bacteroidota bacterium]